MSDFIKDQLAIVNGVYVMAMNQAIDMAENQRVRDLEEWLRDAQDETEREVLRALINIPSYSLAKLKITNRKPEADHAE